MFKITLYGGIKTMKRYKKIALETKADVSFDILEGDNGEVTIKILSSNSDKQNNIENFKNPPVPEGWIHVCGEWNNGFVIERVSDKSQFVWVPVGSLKTNGRINGCKMTKFGRRNSYYAKLLNKDSQSYELLTGVFTRQIDSVNKYGGFYISCYLISWSQASIKSKRIYSFASFEDAKEAAASIVKNNDLISSHLVFGSEYDSVIEWIGDYNQNKDCECINNIYNFYGYMMEWSEEFYNVEKKVTPEVIIRGKDKQRYLEGLVFHEDLKKEVEVGFRAALCIK